MDEFIDLTSIIVSPQTYYGGCLVKPWRLTLLNISTHNPAQWEKQLSFIPRLFKKKQLSYRVEMVAAVYELTCKHSAMESIHYCPYS